MTLFQAIILAIVEGITEFLPVSSTGHMIITSSLMGIASDQFTKDYTVAIQFGAILSVIVLYWQRFFKTLDFYYKLFVGFLPAAVIGLLLADKIDALLENVIVVAFMLLIGGVFFLFVDKIFKDKETEEEQEVSYGQALKIGFFQTIAMLPGVSRSAATIIGGMAQGLNRRTAAEFSFFLAVPTMFAATAYKMLKSYENIGSEHVTNLVVGNVVAFFVALLAIKGFITYLNKHGFKMFGYYRIVVGLLILILHFAGISLEIV